MADQIRKNQIFSIVTFVTCNHKLLTHMLTSVVQTSENKSVEIESEETDSNCEEAILNAYIRRIRGKQQKPTRIVGYVKDVIPRYTPKQFRYHFRMIPEVFEILENRIGRLLYDVERLGRPMIPIRTQLLATIWLLATPDSFRSVGEKFDLSKSSLNDCVHHIVKTLNTIANEIIKWPEGPRLAASKEKFICFGDAPMPGTVGVIDGTYIYIKKPNLQETAIHYKCRKLQYAVILQAVCDADLLFIDCFAGYPGSVGDYRVFRNSDLYREIQRDVSAFFPNGEFIVGDKVYPVLTWCIPPFRDNGRLTQEQKTFNKIISQKRQVIERAFALLKGRFRRLKFLDMSRIDLVPFFIIAACVLHNICLEGINDNVEDFIQEGREEEQQEEINYDRENEEHNVRRHEFDDGEIKRNYLCLQVAGRQ